VPLALTDKVLIRINATRNVNSFTDIDPIHAAIGCAGCHGGSSLVDAKDDTSAFREAHTGMLRDPSAIGELGCSGGSCHADIVARNETSIHSNLWGEKAHVALRNGYESWEECPADIKDGFARDCNSCHTTCGQCHISRPNAAGGGFLEQRVGYSHKFLATPDEANVCTACHGSRVGDDWNANQDRLPGNVPDVHNEFGYTCLSCHTEDMHGEGASDAEHTSRYQVAELPQCVDCHEVDNDDNAYHTSHWPNSDASDGPDLACFVCHSQQYNNCNTCHAGTWQEEYNEHNTDEYRVYPQFKIGRNPYYGEAGHPHTESSWITVRHIPVSPDAYKNWNIDPWDLQDFSETKDMETWKYASPHSIQRWTERTLVDTNWATSSTQDYTTENCYTNCHMHGPHGSYTSTNKALYLIDENMENDITNDDLSDEIPANALTSLGRQSDGSYCSACH
jgi:thiosulfate/3-mercaptopyruvate sulfurtransferase